LKKALFVSIAAIAVAACAAGPEPKAATAAAPAAPATPRCTQPPTALEVKDLQEGQGDPVTFRTAVMVHYTGWLFDGCAPDGKGKMFDTSATRGVPLGLVVGAGKVIKGWDEGLIGMRQGGKRRLAIPPDKGYGAAGTPNGPIPPNATLVFDLELVRILERPPAQAR
jgi:FKBP-type peptidyl-prolyl cis-trans isomerase